MRFVTNYLGKQVHGPVAPQSARGRHLIFVDGTIVDVETQDTFDAPGFEFVSPGDDRYVNPDASSTAETQIYNVFVTDGTINIENDTITTATTRGGKHHIRLGGATGIQIGDGNTQNNVFG